MFKRHNRLEKMMKMIGFVLCLSLIAACPSSTSTSGSSESEPKEVEETQIRVLDTPIADVWKIETVAGVRVGQTPEEVEAVLGKPTDARPATESPATGEFVRTWVYGNGLKVDLTADSANGPFKVGAVIANGSSTAKTERGVGIGTTVVDAKRAYPGAVDQNDVLRIGSEYEALYIAHDGKNVTSLFAGAGAE